MGNAERLEDELAVAKLVDEFEALRPKVYGDSPGEADLARFKELNQEIANARQAFKTKYPPGAPADGDASPTPDVIIASAGDPNAPEEG